MKAIFFGNVKIFLERERERERGQISMQEAGSKIYAEKYVCLHCSKKETVSH